MPSREPTDAKLCRLQPLATLPVFFALTGKPVMIAGGSEAAAWKAELMAAAGADVTIFAPEPSAELLDLVARGASAGTLKHMERPWDRAALAKACLAICDAATDGEAKAFACAAKAAGVPANIIDKPAFCTFQFGSIVNRSPVVVGISTDGAAPILGQAIRRRIETLLPPSLAKWAERARSVRAHVMTRLAPGPQRRTFWERFSQAAFTSAPPDVDGWLDASAGESPSAGKVTLVGAGPGDAGLLTINAVRALQSCDVILFDDLVSDEVLELARREARRIAVGKRGARESCRQEDIIALMLKLARAGRSVVRLKGGDPAVFGRAGEEVAAMREARIAVDVVPGVTSASAMAARLNVSLTHRDHAQVLSLVTGHSRQGAIPDSLDFASLVGPGRTAIVYMGARTVHEWVGKALEAGASPATPAVAMAKISRVDEQGWQGALKDLPDAVGCLGEGPILVGVGETFANALASQDEVEGANDAAIDPAPMKPPVSQPALVLAR